MIPKRLVIIGDPVSHSLSPRFQSAALAAAGLDVRYEALRVRAPDLARVAGELAVEGAAGNVTVPHKTEFIHLCDEISPLAAHIGAVNTFWADDGKLVGDNTDVGGFDAAARDLLGSLSPGLTVALIGAGGSAAAILGAIERWSSATVRIYGRTMSRTTALAARFGDFVSVESDAAAALAGAKLVVNATPVGMTDETLPIDLDDLLPGASLLDIVYRRGGTPLVRAARAAGFNAADGTEMLIEQGALSFERWFGFTPDRGVMRAALE